MDQVDCKMIPDLRMDYLVYCPGEDGSIFVEREKIYHFT